jgi:hypothetical protein
MKKIKMVIAAVVLLGATACNDETDEPTYTPTNEDAAKILEESMAKSSGGMAEELASLGGTLESKSGEIELECGVPLDTTFSFIVSGDLNGEFTRNWSVLLSCPEQEGPFIEINTSYTALLEGPNRTREREGSRDWTWTEIGPVGDFRFLNGTGDHSGSKTLNANQATFSWDYDAEWTDVAVQKSNHQIDSGSGVFSLVLTGPQGNTFTFNGSVVFNGDQTATITINGEVYEVDLD